MDVFEPHFKWTSRIEIIPTAVDPTCYLPKESRDFVDSDDIVLCRIGAFGNDQFLWTIASALVGIHSDKPGVRLLVVADDALG